MFNKSMNTLQQGAVGLAKAIFEYQRLGYTTSIPLVDAQDYDLVIEKNGIFQSVQCRTSSHKRNNRYEVGLRKIKTNTSGTVIQNRGKYDLLFVLCDNGDCYSIPSQELPQTGIEVGGPKYEKWKVL